MEKKQELENQIQNLSDKLKTLSPNDMYTENLEEIVNTFLDCFPMVAEYEEYHGEARTYSDSAYAFFGILNSVLCKYVESNEKQAFLLDVIKWVNNTYNNSDATESVRNLLAIEFFEKSDESKEYSNFLENHLEGKIAEDFKLHKAS